MNDLTNFIEITKSHFDFCEELIKEVEKKNCWDQALTLGNRENYRTNSYYYLSKDRDLKHYDRALCEIFHNLIKEYVKKYVKEDVSIQDEGYGILKYTPGQFYKVHQDSSGLLFRDVSLIMYLNDNFTGGETHFPDLQVTIQPRRGDVALFPSSFTHRHESLPVLEGTKYCIVTWFRLS